MVVQNLDTANLESYLQRLQDHFCKGSKPGSSADDDQVGNMLLCMRCKSYSKFRSSGNGVFVLCMLMCMHVQEIPLRALKVYLQPAAYECMCIRTSQLLYSSHDECAAGH